MGNALWSGQKVYDLGQQSKTLASIDLAIMGDVYEALDNNKLAAKYFMEKFLFCKCTQMLFKRWFIFYGIIFSFE